MLENQAAHFFLPLSDFLREKKSRKSGNQCLHVGIEPSLLEHSLPFLCHYLPLSMDILFHQTTAENSLAADF